LLLVLGVAVELPTAVDDPGVLDAPPEDAGPLMLPDF
jgi:hypothetical protein